jgi:hypothetical protein
VYNKEMDALVSMVFRSMEVEEDKAPHNSWNRWTHHEFQSIEVSFGCNYIMTFFSHSCNVLMIMDNVYFGVVNNECCVSVAYSTIPIITL